MSPSEDNYADDRLATPDDPCEDCPDGLRVEKTTIRTLLDSNNPKVKELLEEILPHLLVPTHTTPVGLLEITIRQETIEEYLTEIANLLNQTSPELASDYIDDAFDFFTDILEDRRNIQSILQETIDNEIEWITAESPDLIIVSHDER